MPLKLLHQVNLFSHNTTFLLWSWLLSRTPKLLNKAIKFGTSKILLKPKFVQNTTSLYTLL